MWYGVSLLWHAVMQARDAREQHGISQPTRALSEEQLGDMSRPLRQASEGKHAEADTWNRSAQQTQHLSATVEPDEQLLEIEEDEIESDDSSKPDRDANSSSHGGDTRGQQQVGAHTHTGIHATLDRVEQGLDRRVTTRPDGSSEEAEVLQQQQQQRRPAHDLHGETRPSARHDTIRSVLPSADTLARADEQATHDVGGGGMQSRAGMLEIHGSRRAAEHPEAPSHETTEQDQVFESIELQRSRLPVLAALQQRPLADGACYGRDKHLFMCEEQDLLQGDAAGRAACLSHSLASPLVWSPQPARDTRQPRDAAHAHARECILLAACVV